MLIVDRTAMFKAVKAELAKLDNLGFDSYQDCLLAILDEPDFLHVWDFSEASVETCQLISDYRELLETLQIIWAEWHSWFVEAGIVASLEVE